MKFYWLSGATFCDCINTIYRFINPFLDNKMSSFEEHGAFKKMGPRVYINSKNPNQAARPHSLLRAFLIQYFILQFPILG